MIRKDHTLPKETKIKYPLVQTLLVPLKSIVLYSTELSARYRHIKPENLKEPIIAVPDGDKWVVIALPEETTTQVEIRHVVGTN